MKRKRHFLKFNRIVQFQGLTHKRASDEFLQKDFKRFFFYMSFRGKITQKPCISFHCKEKLTKKLNGKAKKNKMLKL